LSQVGCRSTNDEERDFETVAGVVLDEVGSLPDIGQRIEVQGWSMEVVDMDGRRIDKLLVHKVTENGAARA
jgi:putative hemolysin